MDRQEEFLFVRVRMELLLLNRESNIIMEQGFDEKNRISVIGGIDAVARSGGSGEKCYLPFSYSVA